MKSKIINFLQISFPFLITVALWRLSGRFWNPAGVLAIIPIFFCSFVQPVRWFTIFSILMCLCLDYNFETVCFWIAMYCLFSALNGFQTLVDLTRLDKDAIAAFMVFFGCAVLVQVLMNFTFLNLLWGVWIFFWTTLLYIPITTLIKKVHK